MKLSDFRNLDFQNVGGWPQGVKLAFCALLFGLLLLAGWWFSSATSRTTSTQQAEPGRTAEEGVPRQAGQGRQSRSAETAARRHARHPAPVAAAAAEQDRDAGACWSIFRRPRCRPAWKRSCSSPGRNRSRKVSMPKSRSHLRMLGTYHQFGTFHQRRRRAAARRHPDHARCFAEADCGSRARQRRAVARSKARSRPIATSRMTNRRAATRSRGPAEQTRSRAQREGREHAHAVLPRVRCARRCSSPAPSLCWPDAPAGDRRSQGVGRAREGPERRADSAAAGAEDVRDLRIHRPGHCAIRLRRVWKNSRRNRLGSAAGQASERTARSLSRSTA